tara:strand:- start:370 stop:753 length:384 start_codon:yes stop_codon:yes gene_type:complete
MTIIIPLSRKERAKLKNTKYYSKKKGDIRKNTFLKRLAAMKTVKPHWKTVKVCKLTKVKVKEIQRDKLAKLSTDYKAAYDKLTDSNEKGALLLQEKNEVETINDFFISIGLYFDMKEKETGYKIPES